MNGAGRAGHARRGLLAAGVVLLLLALGPFASPLVGHEDRGVAAESPVDHRNDVPVVRPGRSSSAVVASRLPSARTLFVVTLVAGLVLAAAPLRRRREPRVTDPHRPPTWSLPPLRGPPTLLAV